MLSVKYKPNPWLVDWNTSVFFQKVKPTKPLTELKNAYSTTHVVSTKQIHKITQYYIAKNRRYKKKKTCLHNYCAVFCLSDDNPRSKKKIDIQTPFLLWSFESKSTQILRNIIHRCIFCFLSQLNHVQTSLIELELICHLCSTLKTCSKITYNISISLYIM